MSKVGEVREQISVEFKGQIAEVLLYAAIQLDVDEIRALESKYRLRLRQRLWDWFCGRRQNLTQAYLDLARDIDHLKNQREHERHDAVTQYLNDRYGFNPPIESQGT